MKVGFHPEARAALERVREWSFVDIFRVHHPLGTEPLARKSTRVWLD